MTEQPTYLRLLCGIANAESDAHCYLSAWRDTTSDPDLRAVLTTVASREGEHGMAFAKRVIELGYEFERKEDPALVEKIAVAGSSCSDREKAEYFGIPRTEELLSFFDTVFKDHSIDVRTGELLGRYIAEEHDTARLTMRCYDELCSREDAAAAPEDALASLEAKVDALSRSVEDLRQIVCAQTMTATD